MVNPGSQHDVTVSNLRVDGGGGDCIHSVYSGSGTVNLTVNAVEVYHCAIGIHSTQKGDATWTIKNSYIHDTSDSGLILWGSAFLVADNSIQHTGTANLGYGTHGIYSKSPSVRILRNDIAFYRDNAISTRFRNALIEGNTIHDGDIGIAYYNYDTTETPGQGTSVIRYNKIWNMTGPNGYGILITGGSGGGAGVAYQSPENWRIYANTIVGGGHGQAMWLNPINATELTIQNNIVTGSWGYGMLNVQTTPTRYAEDHNNWAGTSIRGGTGNINTNPNLSPAPALVPQSGSPVIDAGSMSVPGATYTNACDGQPLSYCGTTADMGAVETGSGGGSGSGGGAAAAEAAAAAAAAARRPRPRFLPA